MHHTHISTIPALDGDDMSLVTIATGILVGTLFLLVSANVPTDFSWASPDADGPVVKTLSGGEVADTTEVAKASANPG